MITDQMVEAALSRFNDHNAHREPWQMTHGHELDAMRAALEAAEAAAPPNARDATIAAPNLHQALRDAVVEAAMKWQKNHSAPFIDDTPMDTANLYSSVLVLCAALTPPKPADPMEALRNAWDAPRGMMWAEGVQDALDAAEKAWKEK